MGLQSTGSTRLPQRVEVGCLGCNNGIPWGRIRVKTPAIEDDYPDSHTDSAIPERVSLSVAGLEAFLTRGRSEIRGMYAVVGCGECEALWIVEGRPDRTQCPRCGTTRKHVDRKKFHTADDPDVAREVRARLLAAQQGHGADYAELDEFGRMEEKLDDAGPSDRAYLAAANVDPDEVTSAGNRATSTQASASQQAIVKAALRQLEQPDKSAVVAYAADRGVSAESAAELLAKFVDRGVASETSGTYRLL